MEQHSMRSTNGAMGTGARLGLVGIGILALLVSSVLAVSAVAQEEVPLVDIPKTGMKSGRLTAKGDSSAEISGQAYSFHSKIVFADDEGRQREWKDFKKGDHVQYHLKQERIDFLVLELPK